MAEHYCIATDALPGGPNTDVSLEAVQPSASRRGLSHGPVDAAVGVGHPQMPVEHVARRLARIAERGVRTAKVQVLGGIPCVMTKDLPKGVHAVMMVDRIEAVRTETGAVVASVAREATAADAGRHVPGDREAPVRLSSPAL